jgi:hypothetical protein
MSTFDSKDDLAKFIKERHELLLRAEIARRCDVKSRSEEENEKATLQLIHNQIKNLQEYIETPNVFERMKKNG